MLTHSSSTTLYRIDECPDLMADACVCDESRNLVFLSVWGRDTAIQEFLARLTLGSGEQGLDRFHLVTDEDSQVPAFISNVDTLEKRTTRVFHRTLFGSLIHLWLFDNRCAEPDKANASALGLFLKTDSNRSERLWLLVQETCPLPLLDHWRDTVLSLLQSQAMLSPLPVAIGALDGYRLAMDVPALTTALGDLIRNGSLDIPAEDPNPGVALSRVA